MNTNKTKARKRRTVARTAQATRNGAVEVAAAVELMERHAAVLKRLVNLLANTGEAYSVWLDRNFLGTDPARWGLKVVSSSMIDLLETAVCRDEKAQGIRRCRVCGCTDVDCRGCIEKTGMPCHWVETDLCSACVPAGGKRRIEPRRTRRARR